MNSGEHRAFMDAQQKDGVQVKKWKGKGQHGFLARKIFFQL